MGSTRSEGFVRSEQTGRRPGRRAGRMMATMLAAGIGGGLFAADRSGGDAGPFAFTRHDTLFLTAATGEPRFAPARDSAERILRAGGAATLDWLVDTLTARPARPLTPRHNHYVERLFTVIADSGRDASSRRVLARAVAGSANDTVRARWLYIGSRIGDPAFRAVARPWLASGSELVRRMAVRVLGAYPDAEDLPLLRAGLDTLRGLERHQRLWALDAHGPVREPAALVPLLADDAAFNRRKVRDMLLRAADSSWVRLEPLVADAPPRERRLLARDAQDGRTFLREEASKMTEEERVFFGVEGDQELGIRN